MSRFTTHISLLERISDGTDPVAWQEFCDRYGVLIRSFAQRRSLQPADCDEVVQDVLTSLTRSMPEFRYDPDKGLFRSYLKTITLRAIFRRRRKRHGELSLDADEAAQVASVDSMIDEEWEAEWRQYHLRQAMRSIEVEFAGSTRAAFQSYAIEGKGAQETAEALGLSVDQVYQAKSRILRRLEELIELQVRDEG